MKTQQAIQLAGSSKALAELLGITGGAISQWGDEVPPARIWQLQVLQPAWFQPAPTKRKPKAAKATV